MINLQKGQKINLTKDVLDSGKGVTRFTLGLGWEASRTSTSIDIDSFVVPIRKGGKIENSDIIYYGELRHPSRAIVHRGDDLHGNSSRPGEMVDCEQIEFNLELLPEEIEKLIIAVNIYSGYNRGQHFGMINNAFVNLKDIQGKVLVSYKLDNHYNDCLTVEVALFEKVNGEWVYTALGEGTNAKSIRDTVNKYVEIGKNAHPTETFNSSTSSEEPRGDLAEEINEDRGFFKKIKGAFGKLFK